LEKLKLVVATYRSNNLLFFENNELSIVESKPTPKPYYFYNLLDNSAFDKIKTNLK